MSEDVTYTNGLIVLGKPDYEKKRWDSINNANFDAIAKLGQDSPTKGASLVAIPSDIQALFGNKTNLKSLLQYINDNFIHTTSGVVNAFDIAGLGLEGALYRKYLCNTKITEYTCVYVTFPAHPRIAGGYVGASKMTTESTLPAIGVALDSGNVGDEIRVAIFGPVTNTHWSFELPDIEGDVAFKYVYVGENGELVQYNTGHVPSYGLQIMGLVESNHTVFVKPDILWGRVG
jgi:hypothetical protein